jgi:hypothetical protein
MSTGSAFRPGFDCAEALAMMGLCAKVYEGPSHTIPDPTCGHFPNPPPPVGWAPIVQPKTTVGLDNYWELWGNTNAAGEYAIVVRGTVLSAASILEDILLPLIAAQGSVRIRMRGSRARVRTLRYTFSRNPFAAVHLGFAIGALALLFQDAKDGIWVRVREIVGAGTRFFITGHSQGAAIATLLRSFFDHQPIGGLGPESFKTYVFAPPKPGNDQYGFDFDRLTSLPLHAFRVANTEDWATQVPLTLQWVHDVSTPNPVSSLRVSSAAGVAAMETALRITRQSLRRRARRKLAEAGVAQNGMPFVRSLNYDRCGSPVPLAGTHSTNPENEDDMLWQHHLGMYARLLRDQLCP